MHFSRLVSVLGVAVPACQAVPAKKPEAKPETDWSLAVIESTMKRETPDTIGPWQYTTGLYMLGSYQAYKRTKESRYLDYMQAWADRFVDEDGNLNSTLESLDSMQSGNVLLVLHKETQEEKYKTAAKQIRDSLDEYPRTKDGAFWHSYTWEHELWADGSFMINPFLARYGSSYDEADYTNDETTHQLIVYGDHLQVKNGLLQHGYDESRQEDWADLKTGRSSEQWCRAMGWYGLALTDILEILPKKHENRPELLDKLGKFLKGVVKYQDKETGRWYQVVNKGYLDDNWTETSCSSMFTYTLSIALDRGYIKEDRATYKAAMKKGYKGVLERVVQNEDGLTDIQDICVGTNVGELQFYLDRPRETNDLHGLGAFLLMNEQVVNGISP